MIENSEVEEKKGKEWADELGAIFQKTSAKDSTGIEELFNKIGEKLIELSNKSDNNIDIKEKNGPMDDGIKIKLENGNNKNNKENGFNFC